MMMFKLWRDKTKSRLTLFIPKPPEGYAAVERDLAKRYPDWTIFVSTQGTQHIIEEERRLANLWRQNV